MDAIKNDSPNLVPRSVTLQRDKECKGSIRFSTADTQAVLKSAYVDRSWPEIHAAKTVRVTLEIVG